MSKWYYRVLMLLLVSAAMSLAALVAILDEWFRAWKATAFKAERIEQEFQV